MKLYAPFMAALTLAGTLPAPAEAQVRSPVPGPRIYQRQMDVNTSSLPPQLPSDQELINIGRKFSYDNYDRYRSGQYSNDPLSTKVVTAVQTEWAADDASNQDDKAKAFASYRDIGQILLDSEPENQNDLSNNDIARSTASPADQRLINIGRAYAEENYKRLKRSSPIKEEDGFYDSPNMNNSLSNRWRRKSSIVNLFGKDLREAARDCGISADNDIAVAKSQGFADAKLREPVVAGIEADRAARYARANGHHLEANSLEDEAKAYFLDIGRDRDNHRWTTAERDAGINQRCLQRPFQKWLYKHDSPFN